MRSPRDISSACRRPGISVCGSGMGSILIATEVQIIPQPVQWHGNTTRISRELAYRRTFIGERLLTYQQREAREAELSRSIVNHIDLATVETGFELAEWNVKLEHRRLAVRRIQLQAFDQRGFVGLGLPAK